MNDSSPSDTYSPAKLAGLYLAFGVPWILVTDTLVTAIVGGPPTSDVVQLLKGLLFVFGSGSFVYLVVRRRSEQLAAEQASLRETRNRLGGIVEASPVPIIALDTDGNVTLWNAAAEATLGWTEEEALGDIPPFVSEESRDEFWAHFERVENGESFDGVEIRRRTKSGEMRSFSLSTAPLTDGGEFSGVMSMMVDVTERERRELDLLRYKRLMDNLPVGIFRTDPQAGGTFTEANPRLLQMFDASDVDELSEHSIREFYVDESERETVLEQFESSDTARVETKFRTLSGDVIWVRVVGLRHADEEGNVVVDGILEDVTDLKERDRQFEVIDRILRHNFRNVLGVILGHAELLQDDVAPADQESVERIHENAEQLLELVEKQRVIVKLLSDEIRPSTRDFAELVRRQVETFRERFPETTIEVDYPSTGLVTAVPQVEAVVGELLENAIIHSDDEEPLVRITGELTDTSVVTRIVDYGPGIPARELAELRLEQPIDQLTHGTGLDLWLTYWSVTASDGSIRFEENEPRGTVVTIELPRSDADAER